MNDTKKKDRKLIAILVEDSDLEKIKSKADSARETISAYMRRATLIRAGAISTEQ